MKLLELKNITKRYGSLYALDNVSLSIDKGEWIAIMGPSGSGKSTMMNIISCMDKPTEGQVIFDGRDITKDSRRKLTEFHRDKIGLVFQQFHLINYLNAVENVMIAQYYHSMPDEKEALEALERVGLKDRAKHLPSQLSGGEQQRVSIARAIAKNPKLLLCDEPTGALDYVTGKSILKLLQTLSREHGVTVVIITHNSAIKPIADRNISVKSGRIEAVELNEHPVDIDEIEW